MYLSKNSHQIFSYSFSESLGNVDLTEDPLYLVQRLITFLYYREYLDPIESDKTEEAPLSALELHAEMYALGDKYQASGLLRLALQNYKNFLIRNTISGVYYKEGRWRTAEELKVQAMKTSLRVLGQKHPSTLTSIANLAFIWKSRGCNHEAPLLLKKCFQLHRHKIGS